MAIFVSFYILLGLLTSLYILLSLGSCILLGYLGSLLINFYKANRLELRVVIVQGLNLINYIILGLVVLGTIYVCGISIVIDLDLYLDSTILKVVFPTIIYIMIYKCLFVKSVNIALYRKLNFLYYIGKMYEFFILVCLLNMAIFILLVLISKSVESDFLYNYFVLMADNTGGSEGGSPSSGGGNPGGGNPGGPSGLNDVTSTALVSRRGEADRSDWYKQIVDESTEGVNKITTSNIKNVLNSEREVVFSGYTNDRVLIKHPTNQNQFAMPKGWRPFDQLISEYLGKTPEHLKDPRSPIEETISEASLRRCENPEEFEIYLMELLDMVNKEDTRYLPPQVGADYLELMRDYLGVQYKIAVHKQTISMLRAEQGHLEYHIDIEQGLCYLIDSEGNKVCGSRLSILVDELKELGDEGSYYQKGLMSLERQYPLLKRYEGGVTQKMQRWADPELLSKEDHAIKHALDQSVFYDKHFKE